MIVRAPATSANLGPGFDAAAVALDLWNELEVTDGEGVLVEGEGEDELPADATNLALQVALLVPILAGLLGFFDAMRMLRLPDIKPSASIEAAALA